MQKHPVHGAQILGNIQSATVKKKLASAWPIAASPPPAEKETVLNIAM